MSLGSHSNSFYDSKYEVSMMLCMSLRVQKYRAFKLLKEMDEELEHYREKERSRMCKLRGIKKDKTRARENRAYERKQKSRAEKENERKKKKNYKFISIESSWSTYALKKASGEK